MSPETAEALSESDATLTAALTVDGVPRGDDHETIVAATALSNLEMLQSQSLVAAELPPESSDHSVQLQYFSAAAGINFLSITQLFTWAITHQAEFMAIVNDLKSAYEKIKLLVPTFPKVFGDVTPPPALSFNQVYGSQSAQAELVKQMTEYRVAGGIESARDFFALVVKYLPVILKILVAFEEAE